MVRAKWGVGPRRRAFVLLLTGVTLLTGACTGTEDPNPSPPTSPATRSAPVGLTFGVWGSQNELRAYQGVVDGYNDTDQGSTVELKEFPDHDALAEALRSGDPLPDAFMISRSDLAWLRTEKLNAPVGDLLDERNVDFGDGYSREGIEAFAVDRELQCMPYGISPMVVYYNTDLVDLDKMAQRGLDVPTSETHSAWSLNQFSAAAQFATRPRRKTRGVYVAPTLRGLAPFVYAGGGRVFNDDQPPTSLAFSSDDTKSSLEKSLPLLRDPQLTLTSKQLARRSPVEWFERGRLGMLAGFRSLVPQLREVPGLKFDVMPMPTIDQAATVGDLTGICVSAKSKSVPEAADFLAHLISADSVSAVARAGYLVPANQSVALSEDFVQQGRQPEHASVFTSVRSLRIPPLIDTGAQLEAAVNPGLRELLTVTLPDLDLLTTQIDEASRAVLDPASVTQSPDPGDVGSEPGSDSPDPAE